MYLTQTTLEQLENFGKHGLRNELYSEHLRLVWKETVPLMAINHPYLMHGVLATSAMHLAYLRPDEAQRYLRLCDEHQCAAIGQFREQLKAINAHNAAALFALAALVSMATLARMLPKVRRLQREHAGDILDWILETIHLTRGARDVLMTGEKWVWGSPMRNAMLGFDPPSDALAPTHVRHHMYHLSEFCISACTDTHKRTICLDAIQELHSTYDTVCSLTQKQLEVGHLMHWFVKASPGFIDLLRERDSMAVLILCHFWLLWAAFQHLWYVQDLALRSLLFLEDLLDEIHRPWLEWAKAELRDDMPCLNGAAHTPMTTTTTPTPNVTSTYPSSAPAYSSA